ncbi:MAG: putative paraquat-inducible protein A [Mariniblastus sp.]
MFNKSGLKSGMDDEQDDDYTVACPHCGDEIYDDAEQCPHCRQYLSASDFKKQMPTWVVVLVILTIVALMMPFLLTFLSGAAGQ